MELKARDSPVDFSGRAVNKAVLAQVVQHPLTILPLAISAVSCFWLVAIDTSFSALASALGSGLLGVGFGVLNYFFRGPKLAEEYVRKARALRENKNRQNIADLRGEFQEAGFSEGAKELGELETAYLQIRNFLQEKVKEGQGLRPQQYLELVEDTYQKGLRYLHAAFGIHRALQSFDINLMEEEMDSWRRQLKKLERSSDTNETDLRVLRSKIESHERRLASHHERSQRLKDLLAKSNTQEGELQLAYLDLVELIERDGELLFGNAEGSESALERAIRVAKKVEERLRSTGQTSAEDEAYLRAADGG